MKKRIFIGCSTEELKTTELVKAILDIYFDVVIWNENLWEKSVFKLNSNFLHDLLKAPLKFDFGILIGTPDDKVISRGEELMQARDNIMFELGLFIGRLGIDKCAYLVSKDVKEMSDLSGIFLSKFDSSDLSQRVIEIKDHFLQTKSDKFNFFPSNTLAYGYFENFVKSLCSQYYKEGRFEVHGIDYNKCAFNIIIPSVLDEDLNLQFEKYKKGKEVKSAEINYTGRPRPFMVDAKQLQNGKLEIIDFPSTLTGINFAIRELLQEEYKAFGEEYQTILKRELNRFVDTLENLILRSGFNEFAKVIRLE